MGLSGETSEKCARVLRLKKIPVHSRMADLTEKSKEMSFARSETKTKRKKKRKFFWEKEKRVKPVEKLRSSLLYY